jgi:hypothetical protein
MNKHSLDDVILAIILAVPALNHGNANIKRLPESRNIIHPRQQAQNHDAKADYRFLGGDYFMYGHEMACSPSKPLNCAADYKVVSFRSQ